tara:strand:- start:158 stop:904 length:747 start_codon:yes stop_codon:yes gene_type:complete
VKFIGLAAKTAFYYKKDFKNSPIWSLNYKVKCKSTEVELDNYIKSLNSNFDKPIAIIANKQFGGVGQNGRRWISPFGGIWISAAYPIFDDKFIPEIFSLSIANELCEMFIGNSIEVDLKWPNDIFFGSRKMIGFLPRVITRGSKTLYVRVGIGMNLNNKTPREGISLSEATNRKNLCKYKWTSRILKAICDAVENNSNKTNIIKKANQFLNKQYLPKAYDRSLWSIKYIDWNGNLIMFHKKNKKVLKI